jgi:hypothetical protein
MGSQTSTLEIPPQDASGEDPKLLKRLLQTPQMFRGEPFDEVGPDGVRRIGYRAGKTYYHDGFVFWGTPQQDIWTIRPDGTATYSRKYIPWNGENRAGRSAYTYLGKIWPGMVLPAFETNRGGPFYTYNFSKEGLDLFRMVASQFPNGTVERGLSINGLEWPAWDFPFTPTDSAKMRQWILSLEPADAFAIYYTLLAYDGEKSGNCQWRKFNPSISPAEFKDNYFWAVFQDMVAMSIYNLRTDLHKIRDPDTGGIIDGLIKYDLFRMPCKPGIGEIIFEVIASVALAVVTAGAGTALAAALKTISIAKTIADMKNAADKAKASAAFTNSVVKGYETGIDIRNVLNPVPQLTEVEKQLLAKASGETKSPTETNVVVDGAPAAAATGGGIPWLLIAGAAAAALLS